MDKLWAPWRIKYIQSKKSGKCIFCIAKRSKKKNYVFIKNKHSFAILNIYPYNNGHVMVAPNRHVSTLSALKEVEMLDIFKTLNQAIKRLDKAIKPQGYNLGINISDVAGAGIKGHLHVHIVPRWKGDTNFMPVIYSTKVVSQSLDELVKCLRDDQSKSSKRVRR